MNKDNRKLIDIRKYCNEGYLLDIFGIKRELPLCQIEDEIWIVVNEPICFGCDVEFTGKIAEELAKRIALFKPEVLITPETKAIALAYEVTRQLHLPRYILARKSNKKCVKNAVKVQVSSITTPEPQELYLDEFDVKYLKGKRVVLLDDVLSTGKTMQGLRTLANKSEAEVCAIAVVWLEGPWVFEKFADEIHKDQVIFLDVFPLYAVGVTYDNLIKEEERMGLKA
ncbi:MAG: phosphoribosyltransferase [Candidatus Scalindua sp.]|jgi:adenine phosphoribosyltransferase|nr:phosphoribosyltransferase [Candidatus Scalindua sp.]